MIIVIIIIIIIVCLLLLLSIIIIISSSSSPSLAEGPHTPATPYPSTPSRGHKSYASPCLRHRCRRPCRFRRAAARATHVSVAVRDRAGVVMQMTDMERLTGCAIAWDEATSAASARTSASATTPS